IDLHKQKQTRVDAFWADLAAATDAATFEDLREHGKWEQNLAKVPACLPFVDAESRSTKHLDESLGWDADCYAAFVGLLAGKRAVTAAVQRVYTVHAPAYTALVARIAATDRLIDEVVYRLYGLTAEDIAVVEGENE
ncbi:MAG: hypothetical protein U9Q70_11030, partial [Chloroflexota bacterium]|nr:hypothetical protein [Chloroflexota bacterium]